MDKKNRRIYESNFDPLGKNTIKNAFENIRILKATDVVFLDGTIDEVDIDSCIEDDLAG